MSLINFDSVSDGDTMFCVRSSECRYVTRGNCYEVIVSKLHGCDARILSAKTSDLLGFTEIAIIRKGHTIDTLEQLGLIHIEGLDDMHMFYYKLGGVEYLRTEFLPKGE